MGVGCACGKGRGEGRGNVGEAGGRKGAEEGSGM